MFLYDKVIKVRRLKNSGGNRRSYVATATADAAIQPIADDPNELVDGQFGTLYVCFVEIDIPVRQSDQITDPDGITYIVKEVHRRETEPFPHQKVIMNKEPL